MGSKTAPVVRAPVPGRPHPPSAKRCSSCAADVAGGPTTLPTSWAWRGPPCNRSSRPPGSDAWTGATKPPLPRIQFGATSASTPVN